MPTVQQLQQQINALSTRLTNDENKINSQADLISSLDMRLKALELPLPPPPPPNVIIYGPRPTIIDPTAVLIYPDQNIQSIIDSYPTNTKFFLKAGLYQIIKSITPKSGNVFMGELGAILDGSSWITTDPTAAAFRGHNEVIANVKISNFIIQNMPQRGIHAYKDGCSAWTVENNEIHHALNGVSLAPNCNLIGNNIHNCIGDINNSDPAKRGGGYGFYQGNNSVIINNRIADCGPEQKALEAINLTLRNNLFQRCWAGVWLDGNGDGSVIESNITEDCNIGIDIEGCINVRVSTNTTNRSKWNGIFLSTSRNCTIENNIHNSDVSALVTFIDPAIVNRDYWNQDLRDNIFRNNDIKVPVNGLGVLFSYVGNATPEQLKPYLDNTKNNFWNQNKYIVPDLVAKYWTWGDKKLSWSEWQLMGQDTSGTLRSDVAQL